MRSKSIGAIAVVYLPLTIAWLLVARFTIDFLRGLFYFPWLFLGIGIAILLILNHFFYHFSVIEKLGILVLGVGLIGPVFGTWSLNYYWENHEAKMLLALDEFIDEVVNADQLSSNFVITHQRSDEHFRMYKDDFSLQYKVTYLDYLLGEYDVGVRFEDGVTYDVRIFKDWKHWSISARKRD